MNPALLSNAHILAPFSATGGVITTLAGNTIHTFAAGGTFTVLRGGMAVAITGTGTIGGVLAGTLNVSPGPYAVVGAAVATYPTPSSP